MSVTDFDIPSSKVLFLQKYFLSSAPLKMFDFQQVLGADCIMTVPVQKMVLESTVLHPAAHKFPPKLSYQKAFLKAFIAQVENSGQEVCDEVYSTLCAVLLQQRPHEDYHYRHYLLPDHTIVLKESCSFVSSGTTGLCAWQASQALAEWCLSHATLLANKCILELGSGVGLTGLVASLCCEPSSYIFSDCHPAVLELLQNNVETNVALASGVDSVSTPRLITAKDTALFTTRFNNTLIQVMNLSWESITYDTCLAADIILAADVVYDDTLFQPLCDALQRLAVGECLVVLACTVRNSRTLDQFFSVLESRGLHVQSKESAQPTVFMYDCDPPVQIYTIRN